MTSIISIVINLIFKILDLTMKEAKRKDEAKKAMLEFVKKHNDSIIENVRIKKEYDDLLRRAEEDERI